MSTQVHERLLAGLRSYAALRLLSQIISWAGTIYVVRHLDSRAFGQYGIALVVFNYLSMTYDGSLVEALIQRPPADRAEGRAVFTVLVAIGLALAGATGALAAPIGRLEGDPAVGPLIMGVAIALALTSFSVLPQSVLARQMAFARLAGLGAVQALTVTAATVWLASRGAGAWALLAGQILGAAVRAVLLNSMHFALMLPTVHLKRALGYLKTGALLFADNLLWRWYTSLDTFLLGRWSGTAALGFYSFAQQLAELPLEKISTVTNDVSLPAYAELRSDRNAVRALLLETLRTHATVGFPVFWGLASVAGALVPAVFGARWQPAVFPLAALAAVAPLRLLGSIETPAMTGLGRPGVLLKTKLIIVPGMTVALWIGCRLAGINGAALAWVGAFPICYTLAFRFVLAAAEVSFGELVAVVRGPATASALMVGVVVVGSVAIAPWHPPAMVRLIATVALGAAAYGVSLRRLDPGAFELARRRIGRLIGLRLTS